MAKSVLMDGDSDFINIPLYYKVKANKSGVRQFKILSDEEGKEILSKNPVEVEVLNTKWKPQTWQMNNFLLKNSTTYDQVTGSKEFDFAKYQENLFSNCLAAWDMTDEKNETIPINPKTIGQLPHSIAQALIRKYDASLTMDEEEMEKP
jgi:hypothetical protein